jgi:hypothetical protein
MNIQTGTIEITGVNPEILRRLDQRAKAAGSTAEDYVRALIEQEYAQMEFPPHRPKRCGRKSPTAENKYSKEISPATTQSAK